jgi:hypothetical protein
MFSESHIHKPVLSYFLFIWLLIKEITDELLLYGGGFHEDASRFKLGVLVKFMDCRYFRYIMRFISTIVSFPEDVYYLQTQVKINLSLPLINHTNTVET